jgi:hypothetical protein
MIEEIYYSKNFWKEHGFASCFECDETFEDLDTLHKHQEIHLKEESDARR